MGVIYDFALHLAGFVVAYCLGYFVGYQLGVTPDEDFRERPDPNGWM